MGAGLSGSLGVSITVAGRGQGDRGEGKEGEDGGGVHVGGFWLGLEGGGLTPVRRNLRDGTRQERRGEEPGEMLPWGRGGGKAVIKDQDQEDDMEICRGGVKPSRPITKSQTIAREPTDLHHIISPWGKWGRMESLASFPHA